MKFSIITFLVLVLTFNGQAQVNTQLLENLMKQRPEMFGEIINHPNEYRLQLFYTQIDRDQYNIPHFKEYSYRLNPSEYFYPASTVKMPLAIMALDKINNLKIGENPENEKKNKLSHKQQILVLFYLGFFDLPKIKELSNQKKAKIISAIINKDEKNTSDYIRYYNGKKTLNKFNCKTPANISVVNQILKEISLPEIP